MRYCAEPYNSKPTDFQGLRLVLSQRLWNVSSSVSGREVIVTGIKSVFFDVPLASIEKNCCTQTGVFRHVANLFAPEEFQKSVIRPWETKPHRILFL